MTTAPPSRKYGATLVEAMVIIGLIAVLLGLLLPVIQKVRSAARSSQASNQFRHLVLGIQHYAGQHDGRLPTVGGYNDDEYGPNRTGLMDAIDPFVEAYTAVVQRQMSDGRYYAVILL